VITLALAEAHTPARLFFWVGGEPLFGLDVRRVGGCPGNGVEARAARYWGAI